MRPTPEEIEAIRKVWRSINCADLETLFSEIDALTAERDRTTGEVKALLSIIDGLTKGGPPVDVDENTCWACDVPGPEDDCVSELKLTDHKPECCWRRGMEALAASAPGEENRP